MDFLNHMKSQIFVNFKRRYFCILKCNENMIQFYTSFTDKAVVKYCKKMNCDEANETLFSLFYQHCECKVQES